MSSTVTASARLFTEANSEYFSITNAAQTGLGLTTGAYIRGLVYLTETASTDGNDIRLVTKWNTTSDQRSYSVYIASADNKLNFSVSSDGSDGTVVTVASTTALSSTATWYSFEAYYDGVNIAVSVNNETFVTSAFSAGIYNSTAIFAIGQDGNLGSGNLGGRACTISVYSADPGASVRTALYNSGNGTLYQSVTAGQKTGLVSWYDGVETSGSLRDAHGTNHLTDNNTVTSAAGKVTYTAEDASQFTAANSESLTIANASAGDFKFGDVSFSSVIWNYFDTNPANSVLIGLDNPTGSQRSWRVDMVSGVPRVILCPAGTTTGRTILNSTYTCTLAQWHMITVTYNATTDALRINVNDTTNTTGTHANGMFATSTANFSIGSQSGNTAYLDGRATSAAVWSRDLSDAEITQLYNRGFGLDYTDYDAGLLSGLISNWPITESSGTREDVHGSNDLTDNNTVTVAAGVVYDAPAVITFKPSMLLLGVG